MYSNVLSLVVSFTVFIFINIDPCVCQTHDCFNSYQCAFDSMSAYQTNCYGDHSCIGTTISINAVENIYCNGAFSCTNADYVGVTVTGSTTSINCRGLFSCAYVNNPGIDCERGYIFCNGELSCYQSIIFAEHTFDVTVYCEGDRACAESLIKLRNTLEIRGNLAVANSIIDATYDSGTTKTIVFQGGSFAGYNATIICGDGMTCDITCYGNSCNNLNVTCQTEGGCTINKDCDYSEYNEFCGDGDGYSYYVAPDIQIPNLIDVSDTLSTFSNSRTPCVTKSTNAINCGDYLECDNDIINATMIDAPVCCTAQESCTNAISILTNLNQDTLQNNDLIHSTAIRYPVLFFLVLTAAFVLLFCVFFNFQV